MELHEKEITFELKHLELMLLLIFSIIVLYFELQVTFSTPINFGDEGFHARLSQYIAENIEYPTYYPFWGNNLQKNGFTRVPLWNILGASFYFMFGYSDAIFRILPPLISIFTGLVVFILVKKLYNEKLALISSIIAITIPSFVTYSVLYYTDILFTFYFALFFLVFLLSLKIGSRKYWLLSGVFGSLAFLTKTPGIAAYIFVVLVFLYELLTEKKFLPLLKKYIPLALIMILIPSTFIIRNFYFFKSSCILPIPFTSDSGCSIDDFQEKYQWAGRVAQVGTEAGVLEMGIMNYLNFAYGNIFFVVLGFLCGLIFLLLKKEKIDMVILLSIISLLIVIYQGHALSRAEDTARYSLGWVPIIALVTSMYFEKMYEFFKSNWTLVGTLALLLVDILVLWFYLPFSSIVIIVVGISIILPALYFIVSKKYQFALVIAFVFLLIFSFINMFDKVTTMAQVKEFSPLFFQACDWIKENTPKDALISTVWTWRATYNCQRNAFGIVPDMALSNNLTYSLSVAKELGITHIFVQKFSIDTENKHLSENYDLSFVQFLESKPNSFNKIFENGPLLQQCLQQGGCDGNIVYLINTTGVA